MNEHRHIRQRKNRHRAPPMAGERYGEADSVSVQEGSRRNKKAFTDSGTKR